MGGGYGWGDQRWQRGWNANAMDGAPPPPARRCRAEGRADRAAGWAAGSAADSSRVRRATPKPRRQNRISPGTVSAGEPSPGPDLNNVSARKNLNETAFFFPHLTSDADGTVRMEFTMPEALTKWKFLGFAHDKNLRSGFITDNVVTAKDLMVQPNPPRFLREGDVLEFTVKVSNQSATRQKGTVAADVQGRPHRQAGRRGTRHRERATRRSTSPAGESKTLSWKITVPDDIGPITYKAVAATDRLSDGEEGGHPGAVEARAGARSRCRCRSAGRQTKDFDFAKLRKSARVRHDQAPDADACRWSASRRGTR